jgi:hypothetical protein
LKNEAREISRKMNDVLSRAACDFKDDASPRQDIAQDIENEIAIAQCRRRMLAVVAHLPYGFRGLRPQDSLRSNSRCQRIWTALRHARALPRHLRPDRKPSVVPGGLTQSDTIVRNGGWPTGAGDVRLGHGLSSNFMARSLQAELSTPRRV